MQVFVDAKSVTVAEELNIQAAKRVRPNAPTAINSTGTATVAQILNGYITSTSAAATTITTPTALALALAIDAKPMDSIEFIVDTLSIAATDTVTIAGGSGVTVVGDATVAVDEVGIFQLTILSTTITSGAISAAVASINRIG